MIPLLDGLTDSILDFIGDPLATDLATAVFGLAADLLNFLAWMELPNMSCWPAPDPLSYLRSYTFSSLDMDLIELIFGVFKLDPFYFLLGGELNMLWE